MAGVKEGSSGSSPELRKMRTEAGEGSLGCVKHCRILGENAQIFYKSTFAVGHL